MSSFTYKRIPKPGIKPYLILEISPSPTGFKEVHITIPPGNDVGVRTPEGKILPEDMWKQKHVTFISPEGIKTHYFIKVYNNKYSPFDLDGKAAALSANEMAVWKLIFEDPNDKTVPNAIFENS